MRRRATFIAIRDFFFFGLMPSFGCLVEVQVQVTADMIEVVRCDC
jgi:hypothetical protein